MARSTSTAQIYFDNLKKQFAVNQYTVASNMEVGISSTPRCDKSPVFFTLLQENIDSPGLLTDLDRDYVTDYLQYL